MLSLNPYSDRLPCLLAELKPNGTVRLALYDAGPGEDLVAVTAILHVQANPVAPAQLAIDGKVEEGEVAQLLIELQANAHCPDLLKLQRWFLPNEPALVPWHAAAGMGRISV